jgi:MazG family protein
MTKRRASKKRQTRGRGFVRLLGIMDRLRSPDEGCPWDLRQDEKSIGRYLLEEAYEVLDAIEGGSPEALREELGDLLFQIVFLARLSEEKGSFDMGGITEKVAEKMIRRHPHVFGNAKVRDAQDVKDRWEEIKKNVEKKERTDLFMGVRIPRSLPALARAQRIVGEASRAGLNRRKTEVLLKKVEKDLGGIRKALDEGGGDKISCDMGELLFSMAALSSLCGVDAEGALRSATGRFADRVTDKENKRRSPGKAPRGASRGDKRKPMKSAGTYVKRTAKR